MITPRSTARDQQIGSVLESVTALARELTAGREPPFGRRLTRNQMETLFVLAHSTWPVTPKRLATTLGITAGAVTQLVDQLVDQGLVESVAHPSDARSRVLQLAETARSTVDRFEHEAVERMAPRFAELDDEQLGSLAALLASLRIVQQSLPGEEIRRWRPPRSPGRKR